MSCVERLIVHELNLPELGIKPYFITWHLFFHSCLLLCFKVAIFR